jgi:hypothetical protein
MKLMTPEEANAWLERLISDADWPEFSAKAKESTPGQEKQPLSWSDFLAIMVRYCNARHWKIIIGEEGDMSLAIFAHEDHTTDEAEARQGRLPYAEEEETLPF